MKVSDLFYTCKCMITKLQRVRDESSQTQELLFRVWNKLSEAEAVRLKNKSWILDAEIFLPLTVSDAFHQWYIWVDHKEHGSSAHCSLPVQRRDSLVKTVITLVLCSWTVCPSLLCHPSLHFNSGQSDSWKVSGKRICIFSLKEHLFVFFCRCMLICSS